MSKWILGSDLLNSLKIQTIELFTDYIQGKGLQPYDQAGRTVSPADLMAVILERRFTGADHSTESFQVEGNENEGPVQTFHVPKSKVVEISNYQALKALDGVDWADFELPESSAETAHFLALIKQSLFRDNEIKQLKQANNPKPEKKKKLRDDQRHRLACRAEAKKQWAKDKTLTIAALIRSDKLKELCDGYEYGEKIMRNYIKELCPDRKPGRRPKDK